MSDKPVGSYGLDAHGNAILEEFREKRPVFAKMLSIVRDTLRKSIMDSHIYINAVEARIKEEGSLAGKLDRKGEKYRTLDDITDILGVRVITFYSDEVDKIAALAEQLFEVDWVNSIDKRKMHELHSFGYNSLHYICRLPEKIYKDLQDWRRGAPWVPAQPESSGGNAGTCRRAVLPDPYGHQRLPPSRAGSGAFREFRGGVAGR